VLTGFNTDVEYAGVVYHVQTEDKGLRTPIILSLVYVGGAILASKRSPYDDLIARGFDQTVLANRLSRQHKLICAAVHAGRIEDLRRMSERGPAEHARQRAATAAEPIQNDAAPAEGSETRPQSNEDEQVQSDPPAFARWSPPDDDLLKVVLLDDIELRSGESATFRVMVTRAVAAGRQPAAKARVVVKTLGTSFRPASKTSATNADGLALVPVLLPYFETGRAAVLIQAYADGRLAELRRIILPAKPR